MTHTPTLTRLRTAVCALALLAGISGSASAQDLAALAARPPVEGDVLKRLPASQDELVLRGESASRSWSTFLTRNEAARISTFQLGILSTISLLPERSMIKLSINGRTLINTQLLSADKVALLPVRIPTGVLVPGFNAVQVSVTAAHRVDCSVKATYELWTMLNAAQTGFLVPAQAAFSVKSLDDLAAEPLAEDGTTRIHLRLPTDADETTVNRGMNLVAALVARSRLARPVVDVGPNAGTGAGFDVVLGDAGTAAADLRPVARPDTIALLRDAASNRLVVSVPNAGDAESVAATLRAGAETSKPLGTLQGMTIFNDASGSEVSDDTRIAFSDLGLSTEAFAGHRYATALRLNLPDDFYAGNYGKARIFLDGSHIGGLNAGSELVFRVNGTLVSSLPLSHATAGRFDHEQVELPLRFFRPGFNEVGLEATTLMPSDEQCDMSGNRVAPRLTIEGTSEIEVPHFAHMATLPQISATLKSEGTASDRPLDIYLTDQTPASIGTAATLAANLAADNRRLSRTHLHFDPPASTDEPGIVIGPLGQLPDQFSRQVQAFIAPAEQTAPVMGVVDTKIPGNAAVASAEPPHDADIALVPALPASQDKMQRAIGMYESGRDWLRQRGFFYSGLTGKGTQLPVGESSLLVASVGPGDKQHKLAGIDVPRFTTTTDNWVLVTGQTPQVVSDGVARLVQTGNWKALTGEAVSFDLADNQLRSIQPTQITYVMPRTVAVADIRPILGGIVSNNILISAVGLLSLLALLGLSTHAMLRRAGSDKE